MKGLQQPSSWLGAPIVAVLTLLLLVASGCSQPSGYPQRPILLVCPWAAGGGTDRVSRTIAAHLESELGTAVNVINATGGKGVTGHNRALSARPDGYTVGMATLELNMMHWSGLTTLDVDSCVPVMSVNEDYAALFVLSDAPWQSLKELEDDIRQRPSELTASGTSSGGAWHLALAGWLIASEMQADDVTWISSTGSGPSLQDLISGGVDMVCCSLPEAAALYESGKIRALGVMSPQRAKGYETVATFAEQGTDWSLGGWRAIVLPKNTPPDVQETIQAAMQKIVTGQTSVGGKTFPEFMDQAGFDHTYRSGDELDLFLRETDAKFGALLTSDAMRSVNQDPFNPMTFPWIIMGLMATTLIAVFVTTKLERSQDPKELDPLTISTRGIISCLLVLGVIIVYVLFAEVVGFVLLCFVSLLILMGWMGVRPWIALPTALICSAGIYQLFAYVLRVPLPRGWIGW